MWREGRALDLESIRTDGVTIYSYATPIVTPSPNGVRFNNKYYSQTTRTQQNALKLLLKFDNITIVEENNDS